MNITYIILAAVYIFGLGTYAYNHRNNTDNDKISSVEKRITLKTDSFVEDYSDCFLYISHIKNDQKKEDKEEQSAFLYKTPVNTINKHLINSGWWSCYNHQLPDITRPSPIV